MAAVTSLRGSLRLLAVASLLAVGAACVDLGEPVSGIPLDTEDTDLDSADTDDTDRIPQEHIVLMEANVFIPDEITIAAGDFVTWQNNDPGFHIVAEGTPETEPAEWYSPAIQFGQSWSHTFDTPGTVIYFCDNHAAIMRDALIHVEAR